MAVRRIITNRAKKSIRNLYWRSTRKSIQRKQETKSLVDAMVELVDTTPLSPSSESRGILGVWKNKGYTIFESTHCFVRYSSGIGCKPMNSKQRLKRKWYFACVVDIRRNTVYIVNAVFAKYIDRMNDNTPTAIKFMNAMKGVYTRKAKKDAEKRQLTIQFPENESKKQLLQQVINECVDKCLNEYLSKKGNLIWRRFRNNGIGDQYGDRQEYRNFVRRQRRKAKSKGKKCDSSIYFQPLRIVHNEWLIHFTGENEMKSIVSNGFNGTKLSLTPYSTAQRSNRVGYNYAFLLSDIVNGDKEGREIYNFICDNAVVFKSNGVLGYHYGDRNRQVIFYGRDVKEKLCLSSICYGENLVLTNNSGRVLFKGNRHHGNNGEYYDGGTWLDRLCDVMKWLQNNEQQYKNLIK